MHVVRWEGSLVAWANDYGVKLFDYDRNQRISYMGYAVRNADFRFVAWYRWDGPAELPHCEGLMAVELYKHVGDDGGAALLQRRSQDDVPDDLSAVSSLKDDDQAGSNSRKRKPHPLSPIPSAPVVESDDEPAEPSPKKKKTPKKSPPKRKSLGRAAKKSS